MNFKLVTFITLITVGLTVRGDTPHNIVITKKMTPQQCVQELIDTQSRYQARTEIECMSPEDRKEIHKVLQEKLVVWIAEHGSCATLKAQKTKRLMKDPGVIMLPTITATVSLLSGFKLFQNIFHPRGEINIPDYNGIFKYFGMTTPNQKLATVVLASAAATAFFTLFCHDSMRDIDNQNAEIDHKNKALDNKINELDFIESLLRYCA